MSKRLLLSVLFLILVTASILIGLRVIRPPRSELTETLYQGIVYTRMIRSEPRPMVIHVAQIDLTAPGIGLLVTPGQETGGMELPARTPSEFLADFGLQLAINGDFFSPQHADAPWDYYPHSYDPVNVSGLAISDGVTYSRGSPTQGVVCILADNSVQIARGGCPNNTTQAVSGHPLLMVEGRLRSSPTSWYRAPPHPRTAVAVDEAGETLWLIVIDGRQPTYSEGALLPELAEIAQELGAYAAINLDGGGSTALVTEQKRRWGFHSLNAPIHTRIPMHQRPVANHLGVYALPLSEE